MGPLGWLGVRGGLSVFGMRVAAGAFRLLGRHERYRECLLRILDLRPRDVAVRECLAVSFFEVGERIAALAHLRAAAASPLARASTWFNYAFVCQGIGERSEALAAFDRALAMDPRLDRAYYGKAVLLIGMGNIAEAIPLLLRNTELQPMSPYGWYQLAHAYHKLGDRDRAVSVIAKLRGFEPKVANLLERELAPSGGN